MDGDNVVGAIGHLTVPIPAGGTGEVIVAIRGGSEAYAARADVPIAKYTEVLVIGQSGPRSVLVTPFTTGSTVTEE